MMIPPRVLRVGLLVLASGWLAGCLPGGRHADDANNPLIAEAIKQKRALNFLAAIATLERALQANPRSANARWELGLIYYQNATNYIDALYHFDKLVSFQPNHKYADTARQFMNVCKMELGQTAPLSPQTPQSQRQIDRLAEHLLLVSRTNEQLRAESKRLGERADQLARENVQLKARPLQNQTALVPSATPALGGAPPRAASPAATNLLAHAGSPAPAAAPAPAPRAAKPSAVKPPADAAVAKDQTYTVKPGQTLFRIAKGAGFSVAELLRANPGLDAGRLRPGQVLRVPSR